ncbi:hypothetical protein PG987_008008 [Apiospora arundinis]
MGQEDTPNDLRNAEKGLRKPSCPGSGTARPDSSVNASWCYGFPALSIVTPILQIAANFDVIPRAIRILLYPDDIYWFDALMVGFYWIASAIFSIVDRPRPTSFLWESLWLGLHVSSIPLSVAWIIHELWFHFILEAKIAHVKMIQQCLDGTHHALEWCGEGNV